MAANTSDTLNAFGAALRALESGATPVFGPVSFQQYLQANSLPQRNTWQYISIDAVHRLASELQAANCMVFRLGSPQGEKHTHFALARCVDGWSDYFLLDEDLFSGSASELFVPPVPTRQLFPFTLLPKFTETSLINLAIASGLLAQALRFDPDTPLSVPATGQGTYSFNFSPHRDLGVTWVHNRGQVEIDAVLVARREGKETLFVIEAKAGDEFESLAKHKLLYPVLALRSRIPDYVPIVPVYIRALRRAEGIHFHIAECEMNGEPDRPPTVAGITSKAVWHFVLLGFGSGQFARAAP